MANKYFRQVNILYGALLYLKNKIVQDLQLQIENLLPITIIAKEKETYNFAFLSTKMLFYFPK